MCILGTGWGRVGLGVDTKMLTGTHTHTHTHAHTHTHTHTHTLTQKRCFLINIVADIDAFVGPDKYSPADTNGERQATNERRVTAMDSCEIALTAQHVQPITIRANHVTSLCGH